MVTLRRSWPRCQNEAAKATRVPAFSRYHKNRDPGVALQTSSIIGKRKAHVS
jgi:hypothetical protein